jgi:hypothetical protein
MRTFFEMIWGVMVMLYFLIFDKEESRQYDYDCGMGEIEDEI